MNSFLKKSIAWLLLLLTVAGGCAVPETAPAQERVPSPTSALTEGSALLLPEADEEEALLYITEVRSSGNDLGAYPGCEGEDWFELYNPGTNEVNVGRFFITDDPEKPDKYRLPPIARPPSRPLTLRRKRPPPSAPGAGGPPPKKFPGGPE